MQRGRAGWWTWSGGTSAPCMVLPTRRWSRLWDRACGARTRRTAQASLRKLALARIEHAVFNRLFLDYQRRLGGLPALHPPLVLESYQAQCALSRRSGLSLAALDQAIVALQAEGALERLQARYR